MTTFVKEDKMKILQEEVLEMERDYKDRYYGFIYITHHISQDKYYIGKKVFDKNYGWVNYLGSGKYIKRAIKKYGKDDFKRYIVAFTNSEGEAREIEELLLSKYNVVEDEKFYNFTSVSSGGWTLDGYSEEEMEVYKEKMREKINNKIKSDSGYLKRVSEGVKRALSTPEYKKKASESQKKRFENPEERIKLGIRSKQMWDSLSKEERDRRVNKIVEYTKSEEHKKKQSERWSGKNNPKYGSTMSEETKVKLAEARREVCSRKTYMYDEQMNLVRVFDRRKDVLKFLGIKGHSMLMKCMKNGTLYMGYYWKNELINKSQTTTENLRR